MNKKTHRLSVLVILSVCFAILWGCGKAEKESGSSMKPDKPFRIGAIYPLTGPGSSLGDEFRRGVELAVSSARARGINVELLVEDSKTDARASVTAYNALKMRGVRAILTTVSACALPLIPLADEDGVLLFADIAHPGITGQSKMVFRHSSTAEQEADVMYKFIKERNKISTIGLVWMNDDYGSAFQKRLSQIFSADPDIRLFETAFDRQERDLRPTVQRLLTERPNVVVVVGFGAPLGQAIRAVREQGYDGTLLASMGLAITPDAVTAAGEAATGVFHTYMAFNQNDAAFREYQRAYQALHGRAPLDYSTLAHNSALLLIHLVNQKLIDPKQQAEYLRALGRFTAPGESMTILSNGDILPPVLLKQR